MEKGSNSWQVCPRCGSAKVATVGKAMFFTLGICLLGMFWLGFIFTPLFVLPIVGIVLMLMAPFVKPTRTCKDCGNKWPA